jgi:hypothetical protein
MPASFLQKAEAYEKRCKQSNNVEKKKKEIQVFEF